MFKVLGIDDLMIKTIGHNSEILLEKIFENDNKIAMSI